MLNDFFVPGSFSRSQGPPVAPTKMTDRMPNIGEDIMYNKARCRIAVDLGNGKYYACFLGESSKTVKYIVDLNNNGWSFADVDISNRTAKAYDKKWKEFLEMNPECANQSETPSHEVPDASELPKQSEPASQQPSTGPRFVSLQVLAKNGDRLKDLENEIRVLKQELADYKQFKQLQAETNASTNARLLSHDAKLELLEKDDRRKAVMPLSRNIPRDAKALWQPHEIASFNGLSPEVASKYYPGGLTRVKNAAGTTMCCLNKNITRPCSYISTDANNKSVSPAGKCVERCFFGDTDFRKMPSDTVISELLNYALCAKCVNNYGVKTIDIREGFDKNCVICRESGSIAHGDGFTLCTTCDDRHRGASRRAEEILKPLLTLVIDEFTNLTDFSVMLNFPVSIDRVNDKGEALSKKPKKYFIDCLVTAKYKGIKLTIVIERDESEHASLVTAQENKKLLEQTRNVIGSSPGIKTNKILMIRYNPNSLYENGQDASTSTGAGITTYNPAERILILRQWIIWWLMNIEDVRITTIFYMWYSSRRRSTLCANNWNGFAMLYDPPKPPASSDWLYCATYHEAKHDRFESIRKKFTDVEHIANFVWRFNEEQIHFPPGL